MPRLFPASAASTAPNPSRGVRPHAAALVGALFVTMAATTLLSGCVVNPGASRYRPPRPAPVPVAVVQPPPRTTVFAYPERGQSADAQARDRYECHEWAVHQSGFDPSQPQRPQPVTDYRGRPERPRGDRVVGGAVTGAVVGAAVSSPRHTGSGAAAGAIAGAVLGAAAESADANARRQDQADRNAEAAAAAAQDSPGDDYRRAITACLQARGYRVQ